MSKVAVVLAGCGVYDGSEINEVVLTLLALEQQGISYQCFAPDIEQMHVVNHLSGEVAEGESRNVLVEAARIVRGNVQALDALVAADFDALVVPGGFGVAKNISDFAVNGAQMTVLPAFLSVAQAIHQAAKPVVLICIAPVMSALICGEGASCTIGTDTDVAAAITATGGTHQQCPVSECVVDHDKKLITTPAYMLAGSVLEAQKGITAAINALKAML
jgi:enhancing lycopene biosynthesis protein 2